MSSLTLRLPCNTIKVPSSCSRKVYRSNIFMFSSICKFQMVGTIAIGPESRLEKLGGDERLGYTFRLYTKRSLNNFKVCKRFGYQLLRNSSSHSNSPRQNTLVFHSVTSARLGQDAVTQQNISTWEMKCSRNTIVFTRLDRLRNGYFRSRISHAMSTSRNSKFNYVNIL